MYESLAFTRGCYKKSYQCSAQRRVLNFAEIDAFEKACAGKNKQWTNETAKAKHDEMVAKKNEYLELAKEYPEGTPLDEMSIADQDARHNIVMDVLGKKPCRQKHGWDLAEFVGPKHFLLHPEHHQLGCNNWRINW
ncbi:hypothetical protein L3X38_029581 [Prunus dulcis]|uniref:Uncharacterized protein n=1 Tax=Prunus dulcis TaxID=3755 RepID=A0AAD4VS60_PRUDU|nr:hypothetical protein L3X38_029581 [Prunus dulcis]